MALLCLFLGGSDVVEGSSTVGEGGEGSTIGEGGPQNKLHGLRYHVRTLGS